MGTAFGAAIREKLVTAYFTSLELNHVLEYFLVDIFPARIQLLLKINPADTMAPCKPTLKAWHQAPNATA